MTIAHGTAGAYPLISLHKMLLAMPWVCIDLQHLTGTAMYESDDIVKYLFNNYGDGKVPWGLSLGIITALSCSLALIPRCALFQ